MAKTEDCVNVTDEALTTAACARELANSELILKKRTTGYSLPNIMTGLQAAVAARGKGDL